MRLMVTGAAGFIGGHLARSLAAQGNDVVAVDVRPLAESTQLHARVTPILSDIRDQAEMSIALQDVEVVFHLAAMASVPQSFAEPAECMAVNAAGTAVILEQARLAGVKRVVMASTSAVYGDDPSSLKNEGLLPAPRSPYAVSKLSMEQLADVYSRQYGMDTVALRYFNVYGPGQPAEGGYAAVVPAILRAVRNGTALPIYGDGEQTRSFIFVGDIVKANFLAATVTLDASEGVLVTNVASREAVSLNMLVHTFEDILGHPIPIDTYAEREGDIRHSAADTSFASERLGFIAEVSLTEGIRQLLEEVD